MRKIYITFAAILFVAVSAFGQKKAYTGNIEAKTVALIQEGDSLYVQIQYNINGLKVKPATGIITLVPSLVAMGHNDQLPSVAVMGRNSYNIHRRQIALMSKQQRAEYYKTAPYAVIKASNRRKSTTIEYNLALPYQGWMADARLDLQEYINSCGSQPQLMSSALLSDGVLLATPYEITPYLAYITPEVEAIKRREIEAEAFLNFILARTSINPDYMNNPRELAKITDMISVTRNDPGVTVSSISVIGYASPEGSLAFNRQLSEGRANALVNYLVPRFDFSREYYNVKFGGENWVGLRKMVEASDMPNKQDVLDIVDKAIADTDGKNGPTLKNQLKRLQDGATYRFMLKEYYPSLRMAQCKFEYVVKGFEIDEAKEVIKTNPQNLSMNEMYLVANTFDKGSEEFVDVFETAVRIFPLDEIANVNAAAAALTRRDTIAAEKYLAKVKTETAEYNNAMGVLYMIKGEYDKAGTYLKKAVAQGLDEAKSNLNELDIKLNDVAKRQKFQNR